jgi:hypothetical protein
MEQLHRLNILKSERKATTIGLNKISPYCKDKINQYEISFDLCLYNSPPRTLSSKKASKDHHMSRDQLNDWLPTLLTLRHLHGTRCNASRSHHACLRQNWQQAKDGSTGPTAPIYTLEHEEDPIHPEKDILQGITIRVRRWPITARCNFISQKTLFPWDVIIQNDLIARSTYSTTPKGRQQHEDPTNIR